MGVLVFVLEGFAFALSWARIDEWLVARLSMRRELRGRGPVTAEEVADFHSIFYVTLAAGMLATVVALLFTYLRFRREQAASR